MSIPPQALVLSDDLLFGSRITGTADALGLALQTVRSPSDLLTMFEKHQPRCVLLDLHHPELQMEEMVKRLKGLGDTFLVGYGSHVDAATLSRARAAGCDLVLPRSKFVELLPTDLPTWLGVSREAGEAST